MQELMPLFRPELYLDPGSGSFLIQLLTAGVVGGAFLVKLYWKKIKSFFTGKKDEPVSTEAADETQADGSEIKHD